MKILKRILIVLVLVAAIVTGTALTKPDSFRVERKAFIKAEPESIYRVLVNFKRFGDWSPWEKIDPQMKKTFSGKATGKGAVYEWSGNKKAGNGKMEIVDTVKNETVKIRLTFGPPWNTVNSTQYSLREKGDGTEVTWLMEGPNTFFGKVINVFMSMDKMIGKDFEKGLANLKALAEKSDDQE